MIDGLTRRLYPVKNFPKLNSPFVLYQGLCFYIKIIGSIFSTYWASLVIGFRCIACTFYHDLKCSTMQIVLRVFMALIVSISAIVELRIVILHEVALLDHVQMDTQDHSAKVGL